MGLYSTLLQAYFNSDFLLTTLYFLPSLLFIGGFSLFIVKFSSFYNIDGLQRLYIAFLIIPAFFATIQLTVELINIDIVKSEAKFVVSILYDKDMLKNKSSNTTDLKKSYDKCMTDKKQEALENLQNKNIYEDIRKNFRDNKKSCSFYSLHQSYNNYIKK